MKFQSTLPARGATDAAAHHNQHDRISIHAPRTGSDVKVSFAQPNKRISIHAPRTGSDRCQLVGFGLDLLFQSTLPARGATIFRLRSDTQTYNFNPRSPHGERRRSGAASHLPADFNPRSPHGERRYPHWYKPFRLPISIHAPRTGSDTCWLRRSNLLQYFNPRSPHGERPRQFS